MPQLNKRIVFLIHADKKSKNRFFCDIRFSEIGFWIYLGKKITNFKDIEKILSGKILRYDIANELDKIVHLHRQEYIDYIGECAIDAGDSYWYLTSMSEKNPYFSDFYLNFCYVKTILKLVRADNATYCIFCENRSLMRSLQSNLSSISNIQTITYGLKPSITEKFLLSFKRFDRKIRFFVFYCLRIFISNYIFLLRKTRKDLLFSQNSCVIRTWADTRSFLEPGSFHDVYFKDLKEIIQKNQQNCVYFLDILPTQSYFTAIKKLYSESSFWSVLEEYLDVRDIIRAFLVANDLKSIKINRKNLSGIEISDLIDDERSYDCNYTRAEYAYLNYLGIKKFLQNHSVSFFIYPYENQTWERMLIKGIREIKQKTKIVGYAHSTVNSMGLFYTVSSNEKNIIQTPDIILVNGISAKKILMESGFEDYNIQIVGSLRYGNFIHSTKIPQCSGVKRILVILSGDFNKSYEMTTKCIDAFKDVANLEIILKPHPTLECKTFTQSESFLPENFLFSFDPISSLFPTTDLAIYNDSAGAVEAAAAGIPVLHVKTDFAIDMNVFENSGSVLSARSPEQIRTYALRLFSDNDQNSEKFKREVKELFAPVNYEVIQKIIADYL